MSVVIRSLRLAEGDCLRPLLGRLFLVPKGQELSPHPLPVGQGPEDAVDHEAVLLPLAALVDVGGQEVLDLLPLGVGQAAGQGSSGQRVAPYTARRRATSSLLQTVFHSPYTSWHSLSYQVFMQALYRPLPATPGR